MLEFKKVGLEDIAIIKPYISSSKTIISDRTIGAIMIWRDCLGHSYAICDNALIVKFSLSNNSDVFLMPFVLDGNYNSSFNAIKEYCNKNDKKVKFYAVDDDEVEIIKSYFGDVNVTYNDKWSDYVYNSQDIIALSGKKYHGQRNFVNRFKKLYDGYVIEDLSTVSIEEIKRFLTIYYENTVKESKLFNEERQKINEILDNYNKFDFCGLVIKYNNEIVSFAIGEKRDNVIFIHIEKANVNFVGAYQMIVNEYAKTFAFDVDYINREDDAGDLGLRTSKQSYHPVSRPKKLNVEVL